MQRDLAFFGEYRDDRTYGNSGAIVLKNGDWLILTRRRRAKHA